jgi:ABC-type transport system involved in multi-copper enzyme maturation permease subunit
MDQKNIIGLGVAILLIFVLLSAFFPLLSESSDNLTDEGMCGEATTTCFYNASRGTNNTLTCTENNATNADLTRCEASNYVPGGLNDNFSSTGILWTIFGIVILVSIILLTLKFGKTK